MSHAPAGYTLLDHRRKYKRTTNTINKRIYAEYQRRSLREQATMSSDRNANIF
jgi:hypothetical protein